MTDLEEIFEIFKSKIIDYEFLILTEEDEEIIMNIRLKSALAKFNINNKRNIQANYNTKKFNRKLTDLEIEAIAFWLIVEWLTPKVNNIELLQYTLKTKEFQGVAEYNHLKEIKSLRDSAERDAFYWSNQINNTANYILGTE